MEMTYAQRLSLLHATCLAEAGGNASADLNDYDPLEAANYLACYLTFTAIRQAGRSPADERRDHFDMLSVYQTYAMLIYAYLALPLGNEGITPDVEGAPVVIAKTLFAGLSDEEWVEIIDAGSRKFDLIAEAEQEHWVDYRQDLDKLTVAFVVAGTDENAPFERGELMPVFGSQLSALCEAFVLD